MHLAVTTGLLVQETEGCWRCTNRECQYKEFCRARKLLPQVALEISSPTTFLVRNTLFAIFLGWPLRKDYDLSSARRWQVKPAPQAEDCVRYCGGLRNVLAAVGFDFSFALREPLAAVAVDQLPPRAEAQPETQQGKVPEMLEQLEFRLADYQAIQQMLVRAREAGLTLLTHFDQIPQPTLDAYMCGALAQHIKALCSLNTTSLGRRPGCGSERAYLTGL